MKQQDYQTSISTSISPADAFVRMSRISEWWSKNMDGNSDALNSEFTIHFGEAFINFKTIEFIPNQKITWLVTDCFLHWFKNKKEWNGTQLELTIVEKNKLTEINFKHVGLVPEIECYENCSKGWNQFVDGSLNKLLNEGIGVPDPKKDFSKV